MKKISIKGVLIGSIIDIVLSMLLAFPLSLYAISKADFAHTPKDQIQAVTSEAIQKNVPLQAVQVLIGRGVRCSLVMWLRRSPNAMNCSTVRCPAFCA
jgi:hypothetical protein